jgi:hypothetical protein
MFFCTLDAFGGLHLEALWDCIAHMLCIQKSSTCKRAEGWLKVVVAQQGVHFLAFFSFDIKFLVCFIWRIVFHIIQLLLSSA